jgi:hypothetical protein
LARDESGLRWSLEVQPRDIQSIICGLEPVYKLMQKHDDIVQELGASI